jgi:hypothetical protein
MAPYALDVPMAGCCAPSLQVERESLLQPGHNLKTYEPSPLAKLWALEYLLSHATRHTSALLSTAPIDQQVTHLQRVVEHGFVSNAADIGTARDL